MIEIRGLETGINSMDSYMELNEKDLLTATTAAIERIYSGLAFKR
jgi:hypothetical protein